MPCLAWAGLQYTFKVHTEERRGEGGEGRGEARNAKVIVLIIDC